MAERRGTVVRSSRFRHVFAEPSKTKFQELRLSSKATESNGVAANENFVACSWESGGGGALAVLPLEKHGRVPHSTPLIFAHGGAVLDFQFDPFDPRRLISCSEDTTIKSWYLPEGGLTEHLREPEFKIQEHEKKVSFCPFHPSAAGIIASASFDMTVKVHNLEEQKCVFDMTTPDICLSLEWNGAGTLLAHTCKDKFVRVNDPRTKATAQEAKAHLGSKASKCCFGGDDNFMLTTGFSQQAERQIYIWDRRAMEEPKEAIVLDQGTGSLFPYLDRDTGLLFLWGKGDGNVRYYEMTGGELHYIEDYRSTVPQKGFGFLPKRTVNVEKKEIMRALKMEAKDVQPISFVVPRKSAEFQADLYPDCPNGQPGLTAEAWVDGGDGAVPRRSMKPGSEAFEPAARPPAALPLRQQLEKANATIAEQAAKIEALEKRVKELEAQLGSTAQKEAQNEN